LLLALLTAPLPHARAQQNNWFEQARVFLQQGNWQAASDLAQKALEANPQLANAEMLLGLVAMAQSQFPEAEKRFRRAAEIQPQNPQTHAYLGSACLQQRRFDEAEKSFRQVLALNEGNPTAHYNLGLIALEQGKPAEALPHLQTVSTASPDDVQVLLALLDAQLRLQDQLSASQSAERLQSLIPLNDPMLLQVAGLLAAHGEYGEAIAIFEKIRPVAANSYDLHFNLALAYLRSGRVDDAATVANSLLPLAQPEQSAETYSLLGAIEVQRIRPAEAAAALKKAADLRPESEEYRFDYANVLLQSNRVDEALAAYQAAAEDFPESWRMLTGLGGALYVAGRYDEAAAALLRAIQFQPESAVTLDLLGKSYEAADASRASIKQVFEKHVSRQPNDPLACYHYGNMLYLDARTQPDRDFAKAAEFFKKATELDPDFAPAHLGLGILYQEQKRFEESAVELERAAGLSPELASAHYRLGQVYQQLGETEKAKAQVALFQQLKASGAEARETATALQQSRKANE
jgi:superkiller protein 3